MRARRIASRIAAATVYRGGQVACSCCGANYRRFAPFKTPNRQCWDCGSLERHRELGLIFKRRPELLVPGLRVLHIAAEPAVKRLLPDGIEHVAGDLEPGDGEVRVDVTAMPFADDSFDVLICNHVMEHVQDDRTAISECNRVLRPGGWGSVMTPILVDETDEDPSVTDPADRLRRFGQEDHVRRYGWDYVDRLREPGLEVEVVRDFPPDEVARYKLDNHFGIVEPVFLIRKPAP